MPAARWPRSPTLIGCRYAKAIRTPGLLPNATIAVDHFHLVKLANDAVTKARRRVIRELKNRRDRKRDPEWANRRRLASSTRTAVGQTLRNDVERHRR